MVIQFAESLTAQTIDATQGLVRTRRLALSTTTCSSIRHTAFSNQRRNVHKGNVIYFADVALYNVSTANKLARWERGAIVGKIGHTNDLF